LNDVDTQYSSIRTDPDNVERDHTTECKNKQEFCRKEVEFINECEGGNFLDLGCGNGYLFPIISDKFDKFGLEVSRSYEGTLSQYCDNVYFGELTGDIYPEGFFDVILCHHVIEHVKKPVEFLKNINHVLKRHGNLVIATPDFDSPVARRFGDNFRMLHDKTHISLFSLKSLKNILDENGFHVDNIDLPFFETKYFNKEHLLRLFDTSKMSPAFYGNIITMYCRKK
jgi:2-polyprenyl-3-methyl-5-hydroxy-6-metoxy-1,4-benzoquinol methylase